MSPTPPRTLTDQRLITDLQRQLTEKQQRLEEGAAECEALRHELADAIERQTATAKVFQGESQLKIDLTID
jgi:hypothetical protein